MGVGILDADAWIGELCSPRSEAERFTSLLGGMTGGICETSIGLVDPVCERAIDALDGVAAVADPGRGLDWRLEALDEKVEKRRSHGCVCDVADVDGVM